MQTTPQPADAFSSTLPGGDAWTRPAQLKLHINTGHLPKMWELSGSGSVVCQLLWWAAVLLSAPPSPFKADLQRSGGSSESCRSSGHSPTRLVFWKPRSGGARMKSASASSRTTRGPAASYKYTEPSINEEETRGQDNGINKMANRLLWFCIPDLVSRYHCPGMTNGHTKTDRCN